MKLLSDHATNLSEYCPWVSVAYLIDAYEFDQRVIKSLSAEVPFAMLCVELPERPHNESR